MAGIFSPGRRKREVAGIMVIAWAIFSFIALINGATGLAGEITADFYIFFLGEAAVTLPILLIIAGFKLVRGLEFLQWRFRMLGFFIAYISSLTIFHINQGFSEVFTRGLLGEGGGLMGGTAAYIFTAFFGYAGSQILLLSLTLIGVLLFFDIFLLEFSRNLASGTLNILKNTGNFCQKLPLKKLFLLPALIPVKIIEKHRSSPEDEMIEKRDELAPAEDEGVSVIPEDQFNRDSSPADDEEAGEDNSSWLQDDEKEAEEDGAEASEDDWEEMLDDFSEDQDYTVPPLKLLKNDDSSAGRAQDNSELLERTLNNFGVEARVTNIRKGPTLTRYEVEPETGVKVSKIVNLSDDIALSLAAEDIRIEAPIPGKSALGIEVPHQGASLVRLKGVLQSSKFDPEENSKLQIGLGRAIDGAPVVADLSEMPHLLIAGATGSGKSVCINSIISSLLFQYSPLDLKMLMIDPKKVELVNYENLPHLFSPLVTDCQKAAGTLKLIVEEMERRYDLFAETGTRDINSYNEKAEDELPYIVVIIDELSDLMMVAASEVEDAICRLAQMSRAAGIHLVIATQRPSVDVITGLIKANIPSRIAFAVSSNTDSRTILDESGAEKLLGDGDMLYYPVGAKKPHRVQGSFISDAEIERLVSFVKNQTDPEFEIDEEEFDDLSLDDIDEEEDELLGDAIKLVVEYRASISMLQRRLHIGHSRAARLVDRMEELGIVGPYNGPQPREVLISEEDLDRFFDENDEIDVE